MSQFFIDSAVAPPPIPPSVPTSFVTDNGTSVPSANIEIIHGIDSTENNDNGIIIKGGALQTGSSNEIDVVITNRLQGTTTTSGAVNANVISFALGSTAGSYAIEVRIAGSESTTPGGVGYSLFATVYTTGAAASLQGSVDKIANENTSLTAATATVVASGNSAIVQVTGIAALNMSWGAVGLYTFIAT